VLLAVGLIGSVLTAAAVSCGGAKHGPGGTITPRGAVGALTLGMSTEADIIAVAGAPDATGHGQIDILYPKYKSLGYRCTKHAGPGLWPLGVGSPGPRCQTIYFINVGKGVLGSFYTGSSAFETARGTRIGMPAQAAARREHHPFLAGCDSGIFAPGAKVTLYIDVAGERLQVLKSDPHRAKPVGGHVIDFREDAQRAGVALLAC